MKYTSNIEDISPRMLAGFFVGWPNPPSPSTLYKALRNSHSFVAAIDERTETVVGFAYALSDRVFYSYIPLLEVLPSHQNQGIARSLIDRLCNQLEGHYAIDICCDGDLDGFYGKLGFKKTSGAVKRFYNHQSGEGLL